MATQPGAPAPDIDRPDVSPDETPPMPSEPSEPSSPDEFPGESPDYDVPDTGPVEAPPPISTAG